MSGKQGGLRVYGNATRRTLEYSEFLNECHGEWLLKNSFLQNSQKQNCARMRYERSSPIARHFLSPKFWPFEMKSEFFNTHAIFLQQRLLGGAGQGYCLF
jgi:hypothetical protein